MISRSPVFFFPFYRRELVNQESRFAAKIEAAETKAIEAQNKADELHCKIEVLDKDLADKSWNVDRK
jgi:hypothetical protein